MRIQPDEGISLRIISKLPGASLRMEPVKMDFHYATSFGKSSPEAYERLLLDARVLLGGFGLELQCLAGGDDAFGDGLIDLFRCHLGSEDVCANVL